VWYRLLSGDVEMIDVYDGWMSEHTCVLWGITIIDMCERAGSLRGRAVVVDALSFICCTKIVAVRSYRDGWLMKILLSLILFLMSMM
jgi:hypothetical protein